jgi:hypothetical protein
MEDIGDEARRRPIDRVLDPAAMGHLGEQLGRVWHVQEATAPLARPVGRPLGQPAQQVAQGGDVVGGSAPARDRFDGREQRHASQVVEKDAVGPQRPMDQARFVQLGHCRSDSGSHRPGLGPEQGRPFVQRSDVHSDTIHYEDDRNNM